MKRRLLGVFLISILLGWQVALSWGKSDDPKAAPLPMKKYVTEQANFVLYLPEGWIAREDAQSGFRSLIVSDPRGLYQASMFYGLSPTGRDLVALARILVKGSSQKYPDLHLSKAMMTENRNRIFMEGTFTEPQKGKKEFRCWLSGQEENFIFSTIEAPQGELAQKKQLLLTILSNIRVIKGAYREGAQVRVPLVSRRLGDGSASFQIPQDWRLQDLGKGSFVAQDPRGKSSFIVGNVEVITPQLGTRVPGVPVSPFLAPHRALQFLAAQAGMASDFQFLEVIPRQDLVQQMSPVYTAGPVLVEEFVYTSLSQGRRNKGYTFGTSFGSRLGVSWRFWHVSVGGPLEQFDAYAPNFAAMVQSYRIDDRYAQNYIAQGIARLRQMQKQTSALVARNAQEIRQMMQAAYEERQRSQDYIDYQRTHYIRGTQDWVSNMEGGVVYHTDSWGIKNTATGEFWGGKPYDYVRFEGKNPKYNEQMTPIDTRELYERPIRGK